MHAYQTILAVLQGYYPEGSASLLVIPEDATHGDFASNIALILAKKEGKSPVAFAQELQVKLLAGLSEVVDSIEVAGPGFLNFFVKDAVIRNENSNKDVFVTTSYTNKRVLVEHSSPNLFKPFSVGHLMNNIIGEFIARAMRYTGAQVTVVSFPSDVSLGIAKALMVIEQDIKEGAKDISYFEKESIDVVILYLGDAYVRGVKICEESDEALTEAKRVLEKMYAYTNGERVDEEFAHILEKSRAINEAYFKSVLLSIDSHVDTFIYETEAGKVGQAIVEGYCDAGKVFEKSEGAIIYTPDESRKDIHTSVFITSQEFPTYEAKDVGLLELKYSMYAPDVSFTVTDVEQVPHFKIVFDAVEKMSTDWKLRSQASKHIPHGRMLFKGVKMSSRLGGVPLAKEVIATVREEVRERSGAKTETLSDAGREHLENEIALSALRIAVLRSKPGININFDPDTSLSFVGDSGPYLMYTHARCCSLLKKAETLGVNPSVTNEIPCVSIERELAVFAIVMQEVIETLQPQKLVSYLFSVAQTFNTYYAQTHMVTDDASHTAHQMAIVERVAYVLNESLSVLGITAPEEM
jgi:arginyl-tRNA synthetase